MDKTVITYNLSRFLTYFLSYVKGKVFLNLIMVQSLIEQQKTIKNNLTMDYQNLLQQLEIKEQTTNNIAYESPFTFHSLSQVLLYETHNTYLANLKCLRLSIIFIKKLITTYEEMLLIIKNDP